MLASTVSSKMLRALASAEGLNFIETLTGFKWMGECQKKVEDVLNTEQKFRTDSFLQAISRMN